MRKEVDHVNQRDASGAASPASDDVLEAIHQVMHRYRARQYRVVQGGEMTHLEGKVLGFFARHPGATQRGLAEHSGRDKGQLARLVGGLRERGLLEASESASDRRIVCLHLTAEGKAVQQALLRQSRSISKAATAGLSDDERRQLVALLDKVRANIEGAG